jgi:hypothetical protein
LTEIGGVEWKSHESSPVRYAFKSALADSLSLERFALLDTRQQPTLANAHRTIASGTRSHSPTGPGRDIQAEINKLEDHKLEQPSKPRHPVVDPVALPRPLRRIQRSVRQRECAASVHHPPPSTSNHLQDGNIYGEFRILRCDGCKLYFSSSEKGDRATMQSASKRIRNKIRNGQENDQGNALKEFGTAVRKCMANRSRQNNEAIIAAIRSEQYVPETLVRK